MAESIIFGYARVSSKEQNLDGQYILLKKVGCQEIIEEKMSGKNLQRPELDRLRQRVRGDDTVIVTSLDRLGRNLSELVAIVNEFKQKGVIFKSLRENIDINSAVGNMQFQMFAAFAEFEREIIRERTLAGLEAARARGRKGGRKPVLSKQQAQQIKTLYDNGTTVVEIAKSYGVSRKTIYVYLNKGK